MLATTEQTANPTNNANRVSTAPLRGTLNPTDPLFSTLLNNQAGNIRPEALQELLKELSTQLTQQLQSGDHTDGNNENLTNTPTGNATISNISIEDSNQDGIFNAGDSVVATLTDDKGISTTIRIPLNPEDVQNLNQALSSSVNAELQQAVIKGFIEMMMTEMYRAGKDLQDYLEKSRENYSF